MGAAIIKPTLVALSLLVATHAMSRGDIQSVAYSVIASARAQAESTLSQEMPEEQLTASERRAIGRYLEVPTLDEVYPGIGRATRLARQ